MRRHRIVSGFVVLLALVLGEHAGRAQDAPFEGPAPTPPAAKAPTLFPTTGRQGGSEESEAAVDLGLAWLAAHQDPKGFWDSDGFSAQCGADKCGGPGYALYDPGVTGLALLAFLGAGNTHTTGPYKKNVIEAIEYLHAIQDPDGCFGPRTTIHFTYNHAIDTLAMVEAYARSRSKLLLGPAQHGVDFILAAQNPYLGWRYGVRPQDNDTSVTSWMVSALAAAKAAGLKVDDAAFEGAKRWFGKVTDEKTGRVSYMHGFRGVARPEELEKRFPVSDSEATTAAASFARILMGEDPKSDATLRKGLGLCAALPPAWGKDKGRLDFYYWYYGTYALFHFNDAKWGAWNEAMKAALLPTQRKGGCEDGSWDAVGEWCVAGGRVYATAINVLTLEIYYRYERAAHTK
jgi:hypothetical protein